MKNIVIDLMTNKLKSVCWWKWVLALYIYLIFVTIILGYFPHNHHLLFLSHFTLAIENNIAVWFSSVSLLINSLLSYELFSVKRDGTKTAWLMISILLLGLSLDEIGSLHERIGWSGIIPCGLIGISILAYSLIKLSLKQNARKSAKFIMFAFILFGSIAFQEYLEHSINWPYWLQGIRFGIEEGTELFGIFLCFVGIMIQRQQQNESDSLIALIPKPWLLRYLPGILFYGMVTHSVASIFVSHLPDLNQHGNPALWYPMSVFFILFSRSFWKSLDPMTKKTQAWLLLAANFLFYSVGIIANFLGLFSNFYLIYTLQLVIIALFYTKIYEPKSSKCTIIISFLAFLLLFGYIANSLALQFIISGIFTYSIAIIFWYSPSRKIDI